MRAAVYTRISKDREGRELGVDRQREDCLALAERLGYTIADSDIFTENDRGASTLSRKPRPQFTALMRAVGEGEYGSIICWSSSRLTRRPRELETIIIPAHEDRGTLFHFVKGGDYDLNSARGRRRAREDAARDAEEAEEIGERVRRELEQKAKLGRYHGGPRAYGFGVEIGTDPRTGKPVIDNAQIRKDEADVIKGWYKTILAGGSIRGIGLDMAARGILTSAGKPWHDSSIRTVLLNSRNAGLRVLDGVEYPGPNKPIVPLETYRAVRAILENPQRRTNRDGKARKWLGAGLFLCERCQRKVRTSYDGVRGNHWRVYECRAGDGGCSRSWRADRIDRYITELVAAILGRDDLSDLLARSEVAGIDLEDVKARRLAALRVKEELAEERGRGELDAVEYRAAKAANDAVIASLDAQIERAGRTSPLASIVAAADPARAWRDLRDVTRRQAIVQELMKVELGAPIRGRAPWTGAKFIRTTPV